MVPECQSVRVFGFRFGRECSSPEHLFAPTHCVFATAGLSGKCHHVLPFSARDINSSCPLGLVIYHKSKSLSLQLFETKIIEKVAELLIRITTSSHASLGRAKTRVATPSRCSIRAVLGAPETALLSTSPMYQRQPGNSQARRSPASRRPRYQRQCLASEIITSSNFLRLRLFRPWPSVRPQSDI